MSTSPSFELSPSSCPSPPSTMDAVLIRWTLRARRASLPLLRFSLGLVFAWFGALKIAGTTPVAALVAKTVPFLHAGAFVSALGVFEVALALALISGRWLRAAITVMAAHLCGTFLVFLTQPSVTFQHGNPLLLTIEGEFVLKNLVLIAACLVVATHVTAQGPNQARSSLTPSFSVGG